GQHFTGVEYAVAFGQTRSRLVTYALILQDPPIAQKSQSRAELFSARMQPQLQRIQAAQKGVLGELSRRNVGVIGTSQVLLNAIFVSTDRDTAAALLSIPGVAHVRYMPPLKPTLNTAGSLINAAQAQALAPGGAANAGAGVKIGIIDSGIDQNHPGFQDSSLTPPSGFPKGDANFTNKKVIVARSFVEYIPWPDTPWDSRNNVPDDLTPRDHVGHGTAIAMIAAGVQNKGPLATIQGIAPKAFLGNYKVQGSPSVNDYVVSGYATIQALQTALADGMDIVTLAYSEGDMWDSGPLDVDPGCSFDPNNYCDPLAQAVESAVKQRMVVVTGAGNDGNLAKVPTLNTVHSPGTAPSALTVAASTNSHALYQSVSAVSPSGGPQNLKALLGDGPQLQSALTAPIKDAGDGCAALSGLTGAIALVVRTPSGCSLSDKITNAENAHAVAVVVYQSSGNQTPLSVWFWGASDTGIPALMVGNTDGLSLKSWVAANAGASVTLDPAFTESGATSHFVADFSSRGPVGGTLSTGTYFELKPELAAPGVNIYTATQKYDPTSALYNASGYVGVSGTSMAAGFAAGAAALVHQKNPNLTPAQIKSALVNTATTDISTNQDSQARVNDTGAGKLNAQAAMGAATMFDPAALSFGAIGASSLPARLTLNVSNPGGSPQTVALTVNQRDADSNASVSVSPSSLDLAAGQTRPVTVTLQGARPNPGSYEGVIQGAVGSTTYRIPYQYLVTTGAVDSIFPVWNGGFIGGVGDTYWLIELKAIDRYGVPVVGAKVDWNAICSNGSTQNWVTGGCPASTGGSFPKDDKGFYLLDDATRNNGIAGANVNLGSQPGDQPFQATVGSLSATFNGYARAKQAVSAGGVVDAATNQAFQAGYAPGSYISIYGNFLSPAFQAVSTPYLPYGLSETSVAFYAANGRFPGRIHYVSTGQINVQIPWELAGQTTAKMDIRIGYNQLAAPVDVPIGTYSPGVFSNGAAILDYPGNKAVTASNPAKRGQVIQMFVNGLGQVDNTPASGEPTRDAGAGLVYTKNTPTATIGGKNAHVEFSGLAPGYVGLYQVNVTVPADAPTGTQPLVISIGGVNSKGTDLPVQ
ncbi:MAG: S8 family serine peptidase, partial [Acidobacteriia bacterium]|nr:S8 family serine peptidase [Terriglobia bacterium]